MNSDTQTIRNYCATKTGKILDVGYLNTHEFKHINKDSFRKFISRLTKEDLLTPIAKGIYYIGNTNICETDIFLSV